MKVLDVGPMYCREKEGAYEETGCGQQSALLNSVISVMQQSL